MTENVQKGLVSELLSILKLFLVFAVRKLNLQHVLYLAAFIIFGILDGVTGAYMMQTHGVGIEANPIARYFFNAEGFGGMVVAKIWFTLVILFAAYITQLRSSTRIYWTVNGFLVALIAGGLMAVNANLTVLAGKVPPAPSEIIVIYIFLVLLLTEIGSFVDGNNGRHGKAQA